MYYRYLDLPIPTLFFIFVLTNHRRMARKPLTEAGFILDPFGKDYLDYARYTIGSFIRQIELKWHPGRTGMSLNEFVLDTAAYGIERAKEDYDKGLFRNENEDSFKKFFRSRIISAFYAKLNVTKSKNVIILLDEPGMYLHAKACTEMLKILIACLLI